MDSILKELETAKKIMCCITVNDGNCVDEIIEPEDFTREEHGITIYGKHSTHILNDNPTEIVKDDEGWCVIYPNSRISLCIIK